MQTVPGTGDCDPHNSPSITYLHKPFVVEGDADGEDVVKENKSDDPKSPAYELHQVSHKGRRVPTADGSSPALPGTTGRGTGTISHPHTTAVDRAPCTPKAALARTTV